MRAALSNCFGIKTHSLYDDSADIGLRPALSSAVGHVSHGLEKQSFYEKAAAAGQTYFIKTHDLPWDDAKAIYLVRDGRSAIVSYHHYIADFAAGGAISLRDIILGECMFGSWSDHLEAWAPATRADTLLLRYEELVRDWRPAIQAVSDFIGHPVVNWDLPLFSDLQSVEPKFFRGGNDASNIEELRGEELDLFWLMHGQVMAELNYVDEVPRLHNPSRSGAELRRVLANVRHHLDEARQSKQCLEIERPKSFWRRLRSNN